MTNFDRRRIEETHNMLLNGQRRDMVKSIDDYGHYDFWADYKEYLEIYVETEAKYKYFTGAVISYGRITNR